MQLWQIVIGHGKSYHLIFSIYAINLLGAQSSTIFSWSFYNFQSSKHNRPVKLFRRKTRENLKLMITNAIARPWTCYNLCSNIHSKESNKLSKAPKTLPIQGNSMFSNILFVLWYVFILVLKPDATYPNKDLQRANHLALNWFEQGQNRLKHPYQL